jgi:hypothetical protein
MIWRIYYARKGKHVHCRVFVGPIEGALGKAGDLCMDVDQFEEFTRVRQVVAIDFRAEEHHDPAVPVYFAPIGGMLRDRR